MITKIQKAIDGSFKTYKIEVVAGYDIGLEDLKKILATEIFKELKGVNQNGGNLQGRNKNKANNKTKSVSGNEDSRHEQMVAFDDSQGNEARA